MNLFEISSECSGIAQRGGLGSVIWGISDAFRKKGHKTTIILPYYAEIRHEVKLAFTLDSYYGGETNPVSVFETTHFGIRVFLIHSDRFFRGEYSDVYIDSGKLGRGYFEDDAKRFAFFSRAACDILLHLSRTEVIDAIHCHDWHTGLIPLLLKIHPTYTALEDTYRLFTVHNLEYQGTRPFAAWGALQGFLDWYGDLAHLEANLFAPYLDPHADIPCINPMRAALHSVDRVTTVSPSYAKEICLKDDIERDFLGGRGLEADFAKLLAANKLTGITNGIDIEYYNPASLDIPYTADKRNEGMLQNRKSLWKTMNTIIDKMVLTGSFVGGTETQLREKWKHISEEAFLQKPLLVAVTRLTSQKIRLFFTEVGGKSVLDHLKAMDIHCIFLGKGDLMPKLASAVHDAPHFLLFGGFDDNLEKHLYASSELMLMPSEFEPCGTSQMKAMRYGSLPVASKVGGLIDTIHDNTDGFLFSGDESGAKAAAFLETIETALSMIALDKARFLKMQQNAMQTDFTWDEAAAAYLRLMHP